MRGALVALALLLGGILGLVAQGPAATAQAAPEAARSADAFVDSVGVNVRLHYQGTVYDSGYGSIIKPKLASLGVRHVRDNTYTYAAANAGTFFYARCRDLAAIGLRFSLVTSIRTSTTATTDWAKLDDINAWCGGGVEAFEGANEPDIQKFAAGTPPWTTQTIGAQRTLYSTIKGNAATRHITVIGPSPTWRPQDLGDLSASMDYGNWHPYPGGQCPTCGDVYGTTIDKLMPRYRAPSGALPIMVTETGYHNALNGTDVGHRPVTEAAAGKYMPRLLLEYFNRGIRRTYLYELIDAKPDAGKTLRDSNFGLVRNNGVEKPAFRAVKSVIGLLRDPGPAFSPGALDYNLSGATDRVHHTLLQKRDGTFYLALWQERSSYDTGARPNAPDARAARRDLPVPEQQVNLTVRTPIRTASVHRLGVDGSLSSQPVGLSRGNLSLGVSDRVTLVALSGQSPAQAAAGAVAANQAPHLDGVRIKHPVFAPTARRVRTARRSRHPRTNAFAFRLSEPATVKIVVERRLRGRRSARSQSSPCRPGRPRGQQRRCYRHRWSGTLRVVRKKAGRHSARFSGRLRGRTLASGRYRARLKAIDAAGASSRERTVYFRVAR